MEKKVRGWTLAELATLLGGELAGPADLRITRPAPAGEGDAECLTFAGDDKHLLLAQGSAIGAVLVRNGTHCTKPSIIVASPKSAFNQFLALFSRPLPSEEGIHLTAVVDARARVAATASIGAFAVIEKDVVIGPGCRVYPFCYVGENCTLEDGVVLFPHVVLYQDVHIGARTVVHAGTILGADGFGYAWDGNLHQKVPQVGAVVVRPDCEIGALSAIDRATAGETVVGRGSKIDNLVQVGHNTRLGEHVILAAGVGIGGSTVVGDRVTMAGMVGVGDHLTIADDVMIGARSATTADVPKAGIYMGFPLRPLMEDQRLSILYVRLPELAKRIKDLERRLAELEGEP